MAKIQYEWPKWLEKWESTCEGGGKLDIGLLPGAQQTTMSMIAIAANILAEYAAKGYDLTLRQLYYQFVSRGKLGNTDKNYKRLGSAVSKGRMWGYLDWEQLVDRGRNFEKRSHWNEPADIIKACGKQFSVDRWRDSPIRLEVWVEKQALEDVVSRACIPYDIGYIACKGYMSQSEMHEAAQRIREFEEEGQEVRIIHLGDHDPSGIDMTGDIQRRMRTFGAGCEVRRIALTMDQIEQYTPPPNPAKITDSRAKAYIEEYGDESWELDALEPEVIQQLIQDEIDDVITDDYHYREDFENISREQIVQVADKWTIMQGQYLTP